jgi:UDP-N-acetyl-alpha-D-muramoyl-L-alanyl-L-glutamate epimerase
MGGGRDSGLLASLIRHREPTLMSVGENRYVARLASELQLYYFVVTRSISPNIADLNRGEALNGHVPVTAINSLIAVVAALLTDHDTVAMANESSASSPTITLQDGCTINHQYSKSYEAELALHAALKASKIGVDYFSAVRPYGELAIAKAFATKPELFPLIMSCNRAFIRNPTQRSDGWCGRCAKCRFVFLTLAPFTTPKQLKAMFGRDLLNSADGWDAAGFAALLLDDRPFDCVGEVAEVRLAIGLLADSADWSSHPGVQSLAKLVPPLDQTLLSKSLAPKPEHNVPAAILADLAPAFT